MTEEIKEAKEVKVEEKVEEPVRKEAQSNPKPRLRPRPVKWAGTPTRTG